MQDWIPLATSVVLMIVYVAVLGYLFAVHLYETRMRAGVRIASDEEMMDEYEFEHDRRQA